MGKIGLCAWVCTALLLFSASLSASPCNPTRSCQIAPERCCGNNCYLQGYVQALLDMHFYEYCILVRVEGDMVYLSHLPSSCVLRAGIVQFVSDIPCVRCVCVEDHPPDNYVRPRRPFSRGIAEKCVRGVWFPQCQELFQPLVADPRQIRFSAGWRFHDELFKTSVAAVSYGDCFPFYRWLNVGPWCGDLQISLEAGVFAVFEFNEDNKRKEGDSIALINADYYVAVPVVTFASGCWSFRWRVYHESSHLGDEFLLNHSETQRLNPSREATDFFASYYICGIVRLYGGVGWNFHSNPCFRIAPLYFEYGAEIRPWPRRHLWSCLYFNPYYGMHFRNWQDVDFKFDATYVLGIEITKLQDTGRKLRLYAEWHDGFSLEGQFVKLRDHYFSVNISFGY